MGAAIPTGRQRVRSARPLIVIGLLAVIASSCGQPTPTTSTPKPTPAGSASVALVTSILPGPSQSASQSAVPVEAAWGPVAISRLPIAIGSDRHFVFENAGTSDGKWLIGVSQPNAFPSTKDPSQAVLYDVGNGTLRQMAELASPVSQVLWASADDRWVVWSEASDQPLFYDWRLRAYDLQTGSIREIARATTAGGSAVQGPYPQPSVSHGLVVWGQAIGTGFGQGVTANAVVKEANLAAGTVTTLATSAGMPVVSWPWIAWGVLSAETTGYMSVSNLETKQVIRIDQTPPTFALDGKSAAFNDPDSVSVSLVDDISKPEAAYLVARGADDADHLEWVTLNARVVAWAQTSATQVYDRAERRLVALPLSQGRSAVTVCGPLVVWEETDPGSPPDRGWADTMLIVDSSKLPVRH